ncbi:MAG: hypothetical protein ACRDQZ_04715 [Mycobacteriales bacterium]
MYGKIFAQIYEGSLYGQWQALVTFQQMIVLCDAEGVVDMTPEALAARTSIPLEIIRQGLAVLEAPDERSRTPDEEGRRIIRLTTNRDWGWRITNYEHYRKIRSAEERRVYMKLYQRDRREQMLTSVNNGKHVSTVVSDVSQSRTASTSAFGSSVLKPEQKQKPVREDGGDGDIGLTVEYDFGEFRPDIEALIASSRRPISVIATLKGHITGLNIPTVSPERLGRAIREWQVTCDGKPLSARGLRAFLQDLDRADSQVNSRQQLVRGREHIEREQEATRERHDNAAETAAMIGKFATLQPGLYEKLKQEAENAVALEEEKSGGGYVPTLRRILVTSKLTELVRAEAGNAGTE